MGNGIYVIGRAERMGLGTMTEEFCAAMQPDKVLIIDRDNGRTVDTSHIANAKVIKWRWRSPYIAENPILDEELAGAKVVVGFETFYDAGLPLRLRAKGIKTVLFPMWEWTPPGHYADVSLNIALSETDAVECIGHRCTWQRYGWPASPFLRSKCSFQPRVINWPPKTFVHLAGNAAHNRDGTREVLAAASYLKGTGARLRVHSSFPIQWPRDPDAPIDIVGSTVDRLDLFDGADCLICPRRIGGHSLPINEATGEGIPCIVPDLLDWAAFPYRVKMVEDGLFKAARQEKAWRADVDELGKLMRLLAKMGEGIWNPLDCPQLPSWDDFKIEWTRWMNVI